MAKLTASASGTNRNLATPDRKNMGMKTIQMQSVETKAGTAICCAPSRMAWTVSLPIARLRLMFSISTVASSTRMPTASARPPSVMMLMVWPSALRQRMLTRIDKGIEMAMIRVLFQFPRKSNILHVNRRAVDGLYRQIIEFVNGLRTAIHFDHVLKWAQFRRSRRQDQVLGIHGVDDVNRRKSLRLEGLGINIDADDALLPAVGKRRCRAGNCGELGADEIVAVIEELLLAKGVAGQANLNDRHGRS